MLLQILIGLAVVFAVLIVVIALQPDEFRVTRSVSMTAPAAAPFALVNDFHKWPAWSPWEKLDPALKRTYEGPEAGVGAIYAWEGNNQVGMGRSTITSTHPSDQILIKLEFMRPFACTNDVEFTFKPEGKQTVVTWSMSGKNTFLSKAFSLMMDMDKICGPMFEQGLNGMKTIVEGTPGK